VPEIGVDRRKSVSDLPITELSVTGFRYGNMCIAYVLMCAREGSRKPNGVE